MAVRAVVFDWGGTLSEWEGDQGLYDSWRAEGWAAAADLLSPETKERLSEHLMAAEDELWEASATEHTSGHLSHLLAAVVREQRLEVTEALIEEAAAKHLDAWRQRIRHDPDAAHVLAELRSRGIKTGLLSNTYWPSAFHDKALAEDGLRDLLDVRLYSSELQHTKPHPAVFLEAVEKLGSAPEDAVFVGDRPFDDIHGAKAAGLRAVLRPNTIVPTFDVEPDGVIYELPALLDLIDDWA